MHEEELSRVWTRDAAFRHSAECLRTAYDKELRWNAGWETEHQFQSHADLVSTRIMLTNACEEQNVGEAT